MHHNRQPRFAIGIFLLLVTLMTSITAFAQVNSAGCGGGGAYLYSNTGMNMSGFGPRAQPAGTTGSTFHYGTDIGMGSCATTNTCNAHSTFAGTVTYAGAMAGYGNVIIIMGANGVQTRYGHVPDGNMNVTTGQAVSAGQTIANYNGATTGNSNGPHIHYETLVNDGSGNYVNVDPKILEGLVNSGGTNCASLANLALSQTASAYGVSIQDLKNKNGAGVVDVCNP